MIVDCCPNPPLSSAGAKIAPKFGRADAVPSLLAEAIHSKHQPDGGQQGPGGRPHQGPQLPKAVAEGL
jgi:hypothetical protein